jgi:hypothetical protein
MNTAEIPNPSKIGDVPCPPEPCPQCGSLEWKADYITDDRGRKIGFCTRCGYHGSPVP